MLYQRVRSGLLLIGRSAQFKNNSFILGGPKAIMALSYKILGALPASYAPGYD